MASHGPATPEGPSVLAALVKPEPSDPPPANGNRPPVSVVLCSYRGTAHLGAQLDSLEAQSWPVIVQVHDDASGDATAELARRHTVVDRTFAHAANLGFVGNFERGIASALESGAGYLALSDQDDVWSPERVRLTMETMLDTERAHGRDHPVLVHSDLTVVGGNGAPLHDSYLALRGYAIDDTPDLARVLGQNGVMGNTVLVNRSLARLALPFPRSLHAHDWWLALVAELYGVRRLVPRALVDYRTHESNASNPAGSLAPGMLAIVRRAGWRGILERDFRLPYLEDSRRFVLEGLLDGDGHRPVPERERRALIEDFLRYLRLESSRLALLRLVLRRSFLRRGLRHRLRVTLALLVSRRYDSERTERARAAAEPPRS